MGFLKRKQVPKFDGVYQSGWWISQRWCVGFAWPMCDAGYSPRFAETTERNQGKTWRVLWFMIGRAR